MQYFPLPIVCIRLLNEHCMGKEKKNQWRPKLPKNKQTTTGNLEEANQTIVKTEWKTAILFESVSSFFVIFLLKFED